MKKVYLILLLTLCYSAHAQNTGFGFRLGANLSKVVDIDEKAESKLGFHAGVFYNFKLTVRFHLRPEVEYSLQGAKDEIETVDANFNPINLKFKANYNYANFRLLTDFQVLGKLSLQVGPQFGILTLAELKTDRSKENLTDDLTSTELGIVLGLGYRLSGSFDINFRYNLGLTDLIDESARNSVFQLGIGFLLIK
ncbi:MAG: PorT family protein [Roseivirga sp.]|nr:PorT family protein [Roseivirga sp.]